LAHEVSRVLAGARPGAPRLVRLAMVAPSIGDAVILETKVRPRSARGQELADLLHRKVEPLVAIILAVGRIPWITLGRAPHLPGGIGVPPKRQYTGLGEKRSVGAGKRARAGVKDPVRVHDEEADPELREHRFHAGRVPALGKPDSFGPAPEMALEFPHRRADLGAPRRRAEAHERQESVGRAARDEPDRPCIEERAERRDDVPPVSLLELAQPGAEAIPVVDRERRKPRIVAGPGDFPLRELEKAAEAKGVALAKERVLEHREERRGERNRDSAARPGLRALLEHGEKRKIGFGERLEEPPLFQGVLEFRMAHVGEMRVKKNAQVSPCHRATPIRDEAFREAEARDSWRRSADRRRDRPPRASARGARPAPPASSSTPPLRRTGRPGGPEPTRSEAAPRRDSGGRGRRG